jgi:tRNA-dihydrouridine synthase 3
VQKPGDLEGECPFLKSEGSCPYGLSCRFLSTHEEGKPLSSNGLEKRSEVNGFSKDVQKLLWKNKMTYPKADAKLKALGLFVCIILYFLLIKSCFSSSLLIVNCHECLSF